MSALIWNASINGTLKWLLMRYVSTRAYGKYGGGEGCMRGVGWETWGKLQLGCPRRRWEYNIGVYLQEVGFDGRSWTGLIRLRKEKGVGLLWTRKWDFELDKTLYISWPTEELVASEEGLNCMECIINTVKVAKCVGFWVVWKIRFNSGSMRIVTKRSLCNTEFASIGILNKLSGSSASVYSLNPCLGCGVIFTTGSVMADLAGSEPVSQYIQRNSKAILLSLQMLWALFSTEWSDFSNLKVRSRALVLCGWSSLSVWVVIVSADEARPEDKVADSRC